MTELEKRNLTVGGFKKKYPLLYHHIIDIYGGLTMVNDLHAMLHLYLAGKHPPRCDICNKLITVIKKYRNIEVRHRCAGHTNTNQIIPVTDIDTQAVLLDVVVDTNLLTQFPVRTTKLNITCKKHGEYTQTIGYFLDGGRCQKCYHEQRESSIDDSQWLERSNQQHHGFYNYSLSNYTGINNTATIMCPIHGYFTQNAGVHMYGHGCKQCATDNNKDALSYTTEKFIKKSNAVHNDYYDYSKTIYIDTREHVTITCKKHGDFQQIPYYHTSGNGCPKCGFIQSRSIVKSKAEFEIIEFIKSLGVDNVEHSWRDLGFELDIYLPDYKTAIEYNGIYWHSSDSKVADKKKSTQHLYKTQQCEKHGIRLFHILDLEWNDIVKQEIWKSMLTNHLSGSRNKIYGRQCDIVNITSNFAKKFFNDNHLQGNASGSLNIGLMYKNKVVTVASFSKTRYRKIKDNTYELLRFATLKDHHVVGGFTKIIKEFERTHNGVLISYANRRWSLGNVYDKTGFNLTNTTEPCYYYTDCKQLWHRSIFQKHKLKNVLDNFSENMTEVENMYGNGYRRIWDCGTHVYERELK